MMFINDFFHIEEGKESVMDFTEKCKSNLNVFCKFIWY